MQPPLQSWLRFAFGVFEVDSREGKLYKRGIPVPLQEQPFRILATLLERPGELVTREELKQLLWPGGVVVDFDEGLNTAVKKLRHALGDLPENPRFIETVPRRGYRFIAAVAIERLQQPGPDELGNPLGLTENAVGLGQPDQAVPSLPRPQVTTTCSGIWMTAGAGALLFFLTLGFYWWAHKQTPQAGIQEQQLTTNSNDDPLSAAAISGDGRYLAFADVTGLHLKLLQNGEVRDIAQPPEFGGAHVDWTIVWFSDSTRFLAISHMAGKPPSTWKVSVLRGILQKLRDDAIAWSTSPDDSSIAFTRFGGSDPHGELWMMDANGNEPHKLFDADEHNDYRYVQWSPDGKRLLYLKRVRTGGDLHVFLEMRDLNGGPPSTLISDPGLRSLYWLRDGRLLFVLGRSDSHGDTCDYWIAHINGALGTFARNPERLTHNIGVCLSSTSATADGKKLVFLKNTAEFSVYVADLDRGATRITPPKHLTLIEGQEWPVAWTPDSRVVIFATNREQKWGFFKQPLNGSVATPILTGIEAHGLGNLFARVSADGKWLVYAPFPTGYLPGIAVELMTVPIDGGKPHLVLRDALYDTPRCAVLPSRLCAIGTVKDQQLIFAAFDPVEGRGKELARFQMTHPDQTYGWALSTDGTRIAVLQRGTAEIHVLSLLTHLDQKITVKRWGNLLSLDWMSDGRGFFTSCVQPSTMLLHVDLQGNGSILWEPKGAGMTWALPSPDGQHIAMPAFAFGSKAWMMEKF